MVLSPASADAVVLAEPLDDLDLLLRHDLDRPHEHDQQEHGETDEDDIAHARVTSSTMPSAPTTRTLVPAGIVLRAACRPVFAADVDAAGAEGRIDVVRHLAVATDQRCGARRHAGSGRHGGAARLRSVTIDTVSTTTNTSTCGVTPYPK